MFTNRNLIVKGTTVVVLMLFLVSGIAALYAGVEEADASIDKVQDGVKYEIVKDEAAAYDYDVDTFPSNGAITILSSVIIDGMEYKVTSIESGAFSGCAPLVSVTIQSGVTTVGNDAFKDCYSLKTVTLPDTILTIGNHSFDGCSSLHSITMQDGVTSIGEYAFNECHSLTSVTIPSSVSSIGANAFFGITFYDTDGTTKITDMSKLAGYTYEGSSGKLVKVAAAAPGWSLMWILVAIGIFVFIAALIFLVVMTFKSGWSKS